MDQKSKLRQIALVAMLTIGGVQAGCAQTAPAESGATATAGAVESQPAVPAPLPAVTPAAASTVAAASANDSATEGGNVAELQRMIHGPDLAELRTTYNGSYGASLLFYAKEMTYYVALFQQKTFWRVIKTTDETRAEAIYRDFARQTVQLSDVEIRRTRLEAQKAFTERLIALQQMRANRLEADLTVARQQQAAVASQQKETRQQASTLQNQKAAAQEQLRATQHQVRDLQRQLESGLPTR
ncbi:DUF2968 domain-containing protein [Paraburkholderia kururiensis]|uniref:DUF2968 domain-containing protein n=1 Tax=Paraburkholderia kururiensis TaxID=984307 RepID=A0ABZ0WSP8_9BURK|nr:DUF2968 domain-containing protein [Paraburkholderia kururiensis]WQD80351.1 DUF2968 domain-containing protein [Paraburkholderia kururiensis]